MPAARTKQAPKKTVEANQELEKEVERVSELELLRRYKALTYEIQRTDQYIKDLSNELVSVVYALNEIESKKGGENGQPS